MARLVTVTRTFYIDAHGKRVKKGTRGAKKNREKDPRWHGQGIPGLPPTKRVPLATDKTAAQRMLDNLVREAEQGTARLPNRDESRKSLKDHLKGFEADLSLGLASEGTRRRKEAPEPEQVRLVTQRIRDVLEGCSFKAVADLSADAAAKVARYLQGRVKIARKDGGISAQTATFMLACARRFVRWLSAKRVGVAANLFDAIPGFDPVNDRQHARRELSHEELQLLFRSAKTSDKVIRNVAGIDRYHIYRTAAYSGLRAGELGILTPSHFNLDGNYPSITLPGKKAKNRKLTHQPIPGELAIELRIYLAGRPKDKPIWPGQWKAFGSELMRADLEAAGVPYCTETVTGKAYADFHALRHTYTSGLSATGAATKVMQTLVRHSDPRLTIGTYTHVGDHQILQDAVDNLMTLGRSDGRSPLAGMKRESLEAATLGLLLILGSLLGPTVSTEDGSSCAHRRAQLLEIPGVDTAHLDTTHQIHKRA